MGKEKMSFWKYTAAFVAFWFFIIFGGGVVVLWNAVAPAAFRYHEGELGYLIMTVVANPIGALIAGYAADAILKNSRPVFCMVNCIVAACFIGFTETLMAIFFGVESWANLIGFYLETAVCVYLAVKYASEAKKHR